jgi:hypothetical protein
MKKQSFFDSSIYRVYSCTNEKCSGKIGCNEMVKDKWQTQCPFCQEESLVLDSAHLAMPAFIDLNQPKTIGSLGEKNAEKARREGKQLGTTQPHKPFWRNKNKIDFNVLKNPNNYIQTGYT